MGSETGSVRLAFSRGPCINQKLNVGWVASQKGTGAGEDLILGWVAAVTWQHCASSDCVQALCGLRGPLHLTSLRIWDVTGHFSSSLILTFLCFNASDSATLSPNNLMPWVWMSGSFCLTPCLRAGHNGYSRKCPAFPSPLKWGLFPVKCPS